MIDKRIGLAMCGVIIALAAAGCGSTSSNSASSSAASGTISSPATVTPSPTSTPPPAWAAKLGSGVKVTDSSTATAGDGSPAGVMLAELKAMRSGDITGICQTFLPSQQAPCKSGLSSMSATQLKSTMGTVTNFAITYTATDGDKSLVGSTGTTCVPQDTPKCVSNTNPAAIFDSGKPFSTLWKESLAANQSTTQTYALGSLVKINGAWYLDTSS